MDTCGAKSRAGTPCKQLAIYENGRCKFHGGLATGPTTEAGKEQCRINGKKGGRPRKAGGVDAEALIRQGAKLLKDVRFSEVAIETGIMELGKTSVFKQISGERLGVLADSEPKPCMLKDVQVLTTCERCAMFAGSGTCLALAKGTIPSMPTNGDCPGFREFESA